MIHALHGNLGSPADWDGFGLKDLRAVDLWSWQERFPGISLEEFGERFAGELTDEDSAPVLMGYSLGGRLALQAMAARPDMWRAAILISTHPGLKSEVERTERLLADRQWADRSRNGDWGEFLADWNAQAVLAGQAVNEAGQAGLAGRRAAIADAFESWSLGRQRAMDDLLARCRFPILWVTGERDMRFAALARRLVRDSGAVEWTVVPDCGHRVLLERAGELRKIVTDFLG